MKILVTGGMGFAIDFIYVRTIVAANILVMKHTHADYRALNVGREQAVDYLSYVL